MEKDNQDIDLIITGTIAIDFIKTDKREMANMLGGAATYAAMAASKFCKPAIISITGKDFPKEHLELLNSHNIDTRGIDITNGKTFSWSGSYEGDMDEAITLDTQLNVLTEFNPRIPDYYKTANSILLGNLDPNLQIQVLNENKGINLSACDTMNFWIINSNEILKEVLSKVNIIFINEKEANMLTEEISLISTAKKLLDFGADYAVIKKGKHGSAVFSKEGDIFIVPSYPLEEVIDPTGAGDSFAGAFMGYLSTKNNISFSDIKKALIYGTIVASHTISDFSVNKLINLKMNTIEDRIDNFTRFFSI